MKRQWINCLQAQRSCSGGYWGDSAAPLEFAGLLGAADPNYLASSTVSVGATACRVPPERQSFGCASLLSHPLSAWTGVTLIRSSSGVVNRS